MEFIVYLLVWIFCIYGILSLIQDNMRIKSYRAIQENIKIILTVKDVEDGIENYIRELSFGKNFFNNLVVIDMESRDDTIKILKELEDENFNLKILEKDDGKIYLEEMF